MANVLHSQAAKLSYTNRAKAKMFCSPRNFLFIEPKPKLKTKLLKTLLLPEPTFLLERAQMDIHHQNTKKSFLLTNNNNNNNNNNSSIK